MIGPLDILIFLFVLGVLIFVHEMGHFLAAKACNVYVDQFSLGMPPRAFGFKIGETDYCIGMLPIGGFVKMAGQEDAPLSEEEREETYGHVPPERFFNNRPIWQRAIVLAAGPFMNMVLAFFIYAWLAAVGREVPLATVDTRVGLVEEGSPAAEAPMFAVKEGALTDFSSTPDETGWKAGDRIVRINGKPMGRFQDIFFEAVLGKGKVARVEIERTAADGSVLQFVSPVEPVMLDDGIEATRFGFAPFSPALVDYVIPNSPAQQNGLLAGDIIVRADGKIVDSNTFSQRVRALEPGARMDLAVQREGAPVTLKLSTRGEGRFDGAGFSPSLRPFLLLGVDEPAEVAQSGGGLAKGDRIVSVGGDAAVGAALRRLYEAGGDPPVEVTIERNAGWLGRGDTTTHKAQVSLGTLVQTLTGSALDGPVTLSYVSPALEGATGLQRKDRILEVEGQPATVRLLRSLEKSRAGGTIRVKAEHPGMLFGLLQKQETFEAEIPVAQVQQIGVVWGTVMTFIRSEPAQVIPAGFAECVHVTKQTGKTIHRLFTGKLSPKLMSGPVGIAEITTRAARMGLVPLLEMMALISINLGIFNLLPLPVLDGGQLAFLGVEAIRRKPVSMRVMETVQQVGILLILGLVVYVTFNDISRVVERWMP